MLKNQVTWEGEIKHPDKIRYERIDKAQLHDVHRLGHLGLVVTPAKYQTRSGERTQRTARLVLRGGGRQCDNDNSDVTSALDATIVPDKDTGGKRKGRERGTSKDDIIRRRPSPTLRGARSKRVVSAIRERIRRNEPRSELD